MKSVRFIGPDTDAYVESVVRHRHEFTEQTGIDLDIEIIPSDTYFSNQLKPYFDGPKSTDLFMSGPVLLWEFIGSGDVQPLDPFLASADGNFDPGDFLPALIDGNRWTGRFGDRLGTGSLWEIPVNCESYNLAYIPEYLDSCGLSPPETWSDYFESARIVQEHSSAAVRGFAQRGVQVWHTMYTGYATQFWAYGARDFDEDGRCAIASPEAVRATTDFLDALRLCGPADWLNQRWYELAMDFCAGGYGFIVDSDHYVAFYENPETSAVRGRVRYALPPVGPAGTRSPNLWTWSIAMNSRSRNREEAWRFIEWAAGRDFLLRSGFEGNMNPTRRSIWNDPSMIGLMGGWSDFRKITLDLLENHSRVLVTPSPVYRMIGERWVEALRSAFRRDAGVAEALESAAADIDSMIGRREGNRKDQ